MSQIVSLETLTDAGNVVGPASSTDNAIARFDGTTGELLQNSGVLIDDSDNVSGITSIIVDGATGNTLIVDTDTFVVDATNDRVGIGTATPTATLDIVGTEGIKFRGLASGFTGSEYIQLQASVQTTDDTETTIASILCNEEEMVTIQGVINGISSDWDEAIAASFLAAARRDTAGDIVLVGTPAFQIVEDSMGAPSVDIDVDIGTQTIRLRVTGEAAITYNWVTTYQYMKTLTNS
jgi:hypothetical protein